MNNPYLFSALSLASESVRQIVRLTDESQYDEYRDRDRFTLREAMAHLADWEEIFLARLRQTVENPGTPIIAIDEGKRAEDNQYLLSDPSEEADRFLAHREQTLRFLRELSSEQWNLAAVHSEKGLQTVEDQANMLLAHDVYHIEHLLRFLG